MARSWGTRQDCLDYITSKYRGANTYSSPISGWLAMVNALRGGIDDPDAKACVNYLYAAACNMNMILRFLIGHEAGDDPDEAIPYFLLHYTTDPLAATYTLTWEKIVTAWTEADTFGRLYTTLTIDFMRKEVWNEPVTSFMMTSGKAGG